VEAAIHNKATKDHHIHPVGVIIGKSRTGIQKREPKLAMLKENLNSVTIDYRVNTPIESEKVIPN